MNVQQIKSLEFYITSLLQRANVNDEHIKLFLSPSNMMKFVRAFTHSSYDSINNYEVDEFVGDTIINQFVAFYIRERFPDIKSVKVLTRIKHNLMSNKLLAKLLFANGIHTYILYGQQMREVIAKQPNLLINKEWIDMLGDVMEAFCGCLAQVIIDSGFMRGAAIEIVNRILKSFFDKEEISTRYEDIFDHVTRLKELYESKRFRPEERWPFNFAFDIQRTGSSYVMNVYGWPSISRPNQLNRKLLASVRGTDPKRKKEYKEYLAKTALEILKKPPHNISETIPY